MAITPELCHWNGRCRAQMCLLHTHTQIPTHWHQPPSLFSGKARVNITKISPVHAWHQFGYLRPESRLLRHKNAKQYRQIEQHTENLTSTKKSFPRRDSKHNSHQGNQQASLNFFHVLRNSLPGTLCTGLPPRLPALFRLLDTALQRKLQM